MSGQDEEAEVPVLVVGGSLVGLSTALFLASHGIESLVVERHSGTAIRPQGCRWSSRTSPPGRPSPTSPTGSLKGGSSWRATPRTWSRRTGASAATPASTTRTTSPGRSRTERRPVGEFTVEQSYARYVTRVAPYLGTAGAQPVLDDLYLELGYRYDSPAVIAEPADVQLAHQHPRDCQGQPGTRAPHVWLHRQGARLSTLDLFGGNFVLLSGAQGAAWHDPARDAARRLGAGLDAYRVGDGTSDLVDSGSRFCAAYGITPDGAVLVRPDGFVAWRALDAADATAEVITSVLSRVLCRTDTAGAPPASEIRMVAPLAADDAAGGDPVCWAHLVCDECGAITTEGHRAGCSRSR